MGSLTTDMTTLKEVDQILTKIIVPIVPLSPLPMPLLADLIMDMDFLNFYTRPLHIESNNIDLEDIGRDL